MNKIIQSEASSIVNKKTKLLDDKDYKVLMIANIVMFISILIHDADHVRQAINWGYTIPLALWCFNITVYVPTTLALFLTKNRFSSASTVTCITALAVAIAFGRVHLLGSSHSIWGIWTKSYFELGADMISWINLAYIVGVGVFVSITGAIIRRRLSKKA